jgi:hypothetical protein
MAAMPKTSNQSVYFAGSIYMPAEHGKQEQKANDIASAFLSDIAKELGIDYKPVSNENSARTHSINPTLAMKNVRSNSAFLKNNSGSDHTHPRPVNINDDTMIKSGVNNSRFEGKSSLAKTPEDGFT